jgi:hypothetical protein
MNKIMPPPDVRSAAKQLCLLACYKSERFVDDILISREALKDMSLQAMRRGDFDKALDATNIVRDWQRGEPCDARR